MWFTRLIAVLATAVALVGCGPSTTKIPVKPPAPQEQIKGVLQGLAKTGEKTSGLMVVREQLEEMKKTDAAKADALLKDLNDLEAAKDAAAVKAQAQKMLEKL